MEQRGQAHAPAPRGVTDRATLYLCRQGPRWVVVMESPGFTGALAFGHAGSDADDARFALLARTHYACPDAAVSSRDGAVDAADFEWRLEVEGMAVAPGDLGRALHRELSTGSPREGHAAQPAAARRCPWGRRSPCTGRPRVF
jgi:hypothetical protein